MLIIPCDVENQPYISWLTKDVTLRGYETDCGCPITRVKHDYNYQHLWVVIHDQDKAKEMGYTINKHVLEKTCIEIYGPVIICRKDGNNNYVSVTQGDVELWPALFKIDNDDN